MTTDIIDTPQEATRGKTSKSEVLTANAVVFESPHEVALRPVELNKPGENDLLVDIQASAISSGTERLFWEGEMPSFPGMGYPLVPGYEALGTIRIAGAATGRRPGERVFVPGARCHRVVNSLFGAASSSVVVAADRAFAIDDGIGDEGLLLALAATAYHALHVDQGPLVVPELIIGHGVMGRLLARICLALNYPAPTVWEINPARRATHDRYNVIDPADDDRKDYRCIVDVSGDSAVLDTAIARMSKSPGGEAVAQLILAGFYKQPVTFQFAPAFMREVRLQVAAEWLPGDLQAVHEMAVSGELSLEGLLTHRSSPLNAPSAYNTAFNDQSCLKMMLDWRDLQ